mmetsp:Transcript_103756/g.178774  ORF Transcript_103756/g.178774 Transcript_103756/m.178774 type:complete len:197 (-) Transcript_103756:1753-2343(-)
MIPPTSLHPSPHIMHKQQQQKQARHKYIFAPVRAHYAARASNFGVRLTHMASLDPNSQRFDPTLATVSGFLVLNPLKTSNWVRQKPEMDSTPSRYGVSPGYQLLCGDPKVIGWGTIRGACTLMPGYHVSPRRLAHTYCVAPPDAFQSRKVGPRGWQHGVPLFCYPESISSTGLNRFDAFRIVAEGSSFPLQLFRHI